MVSFLNVSWECHPAHCQQSVFGQPLVPAYLALGTQQMPPRTQVPRCCLRHTAEESIWLSWGASSWRRHFGEEGDTPQGPQTGKQDARVHHSSLRTYRAAFPYSGVKPLILQFLTSSFAAWFWISLQYTIVEAPLWTPPSTFFFSFAFCPCQLPCIWGRTLFLRFCSFEYSCHANIFSLLFIHLLMK